MPDDSSFQNFEDLLKRKGLVYEIISADNKKIFKVAGYSIIQGKYIGKSIQVGFPIPNDFPITAPYGIHVKSDHGFVENIPNINPSPLGSDWQFWSRSVNNWTPGYRNSQYYLDHVNRWLELS
jgi:hypothetical protein